MRKISNFLTDLVPWLDHPSEITITSATDFEEVACNERKNQPTLCWGRLIALIRKFMADFFRDYMQGVSCSLRQGGFLAPAVFLYRQVFRLT